MDVYLIHKFCRRVLLDAEFRCLALHDPDAAVATMPLGEEERGALLAGDVGRLNRAGASGFSLLILSRFELFGLTLPVFNRRIRTGSTE